MRSVLPAAQLRRLRREAPAYVRMIDACKRDTIFRAITSVAAFSGEPELLYAALLYAHSNGVQVVMVPSRGQPETGEAP